MTSWKTSLGGALAALGTFLWGAPVALRELGFTEVLDPSITKWCILIGLAASAGGVFFIGLFGRDNNVSSEDVQRARAEKEEKKAVNDWLGGKGAVWLAIACVGGLLLQTGCVPKRNIAPGADPLVVQAEQLSKETAKNLDEFDSWVRRNHFALPKDVLAAHALMQEQAPKALTDLRTATKTYKQSRNPANSSALQNRITALQSVLDLIREHYKP